MSDAAQGAIELVVFFAAVVAAGWVMRGRLTDVAGGPSGDDAVAPVVDASTASGRAA